MPDIPGNIQTPTEDNLHRRRSSKCLDPKSRELLSPVGRGRFKVMYLLTFHSDFYLEYWLNTGFCFHTNTFSLMEKGKG